MVTILTAEQQEKIDQILVHYQFANVEDVIDDALDLLLDHQKLEHLRGVLAESVADEERGDVRELSPELLQEIRANAMEKSRSGVQPDADVVP